MTSAPRSVLAAWCVFAALLYLAGFMLTLPAPFVRLLDLEAVARILAPAAAVAGAVLLAWRGWVAKEVLRPPMLSAGIAVVAGYAMGSIAPLAEPVAIDHDGAEVAAVRIVQTGHGPIYRLEGGGTFVMIPD